MTMKHRLTTGWGVFFPCRLIIKRTRRWAALRYHTVIVRRPDEMDAVGAYKRRCTFYGSHGVVSVATVE